MDGQSLLLLRGQVGGIILGTIFLFVGLAACGIGALRGGGRVRVLLWFGIFSAVYGARMLAQEPVAFGLLPQAVWGSRPYVIAILTYLILIPALLFWTELSIGKLHRFLQLAVIAAFVIGLAGVCSIFISDSPYGFMPYNRLVAIVMLLVLGVMNVVPALADRFLVIRSRVAAIGTLVLAAAALHSNLKDVLDLPSYTLLEPLAFALFVFSLGYVAAEKIFSDERRLLSIESELAVAREIQSSILPRGVPELTTLRIHAAYLPMTAVAGDFYEFIAVDQYRVGVLVADVSGHGVPAALIAAMIKVATQSVLSCADNPPEVLRRLHRILFGQLQGRFVSAAYLWFDTDARKALYSAAGHPPLLHWRKGELERIESNGLLFGVIPDCDFPVCEIPIESGDRFLIYTDGVVEPENAERESFGDHKLEEVIRRNQTHSPSETSKGLLLELEQWQPESVPQQDDITLILIDVV